MKLSGHAAGGLITTRVLFKMLRPDSDLERLKYLIIGAIAGTVPDWDGLIYLINKKQLKIESDFRHHTWITHTFVFHWAISLVVYVFGKIIQKNAIKKKAMILGAGSTIHLLQDTIGTGDGIMLFYPLTKKMFGVGLSNLHGNEWEADYVTRPIYNVERSLKVVAVLIVALEVFRSIKQRPQ
jgi:membrane-bound metal-dependent hydrolase YbcI (DUF457 family)